MQITYRSIREIEKREADRIFAEAAKNPYLGDLVYDRRTDKTIYFSDGAKAIGFAIPRQESGYYRVGPIYVTPEYQGKGIAQTFVKEFFKSRQGRAYIEPENAASRKLFESVGFKATGRILKDKEGVQYLQYEWRPGTKVLSW